MKDFEAQPSAATTAPVAPEEISGAALLTARRTASGLASVPELPPTPPLHSDDGRATLTDTMLTVRGQQFLLLELERAELTPVRWLLWYLLGGLGLAAVMIAFLQNWLHTGPAMLGMAITALLLAYGHRGTNRLRLHRLGREMVNFALPGETSPWQRFTAEVNRRIYRVHDQAAREAAALLAAADEAMRQAAEAAQTAAATAEPQQDTKDNSLSHN
ncbi:hypothetical protein [Hymenobacter terrenus]|uniref:hypothetical protein n=1 Tax=Hymenobacter terrenus TaxID=1629124 RepID=UPI000619E2AF|nr:hypothetical protein [Hymenobacter terrenus]